MKEFTNNQIITKPSNRSFREALICIDAQGYLRYVNDLALSLLHIQTDAEGNSHIKDILFDEIINQVGIKIDSTHLWFLIQSTTNESNFQAKTSIKGIEIWVDIYIYYIAERKQWDLSFIDISELVRRFNNLKKSELHLHTLVASLDDIVFEISKDGVFNNCWTNKENLLFNARELFLGKSIFHIIPIPLAEKMYLGIQEVLKTGNIFTIDFQAPPHLLKDKWFNLRIKPIALNHNAVIGVVSDITETKNLALQQEIQEKKFNQAFHFSGIGMAIVDMDGKCIDANSQLLEILGINEKEIRSFNFITNTHPDDLNESLDKRDKIIKGELQYYTIEKRYQHADGHYIWCSSTLSVIKDKNGKSLFLINQIIDISESKKNFSILQSQKAELESIRVDLESKIKQLEEFNQIVSHNLRGPAGNIRMLTDSILDNFSDAGPALKQHIEYLRTCSDNLIETLQDLSSIIEVHSPNTLRYEDCSFDQVLQKIMDQLSVEITKTKARIIKDFQVETILYPKVYLESIIYNLFSNALKYRTNDRTPTIHITTEIKNDSIYMKVEDNGIGIDISKYKHKLFAFRNIFHSGFDSRGVGLFLTRYQIETLGGKIFVESTPNLGSTFTVKF